MSNLGGTTFKFVYANRSRMENKMSPKRDSYDVYYSKVDESPPDYNSITDVVVAYNVDNE